ncbi:Protein of unknown function [Reichenbachiella faecimaris]|uniref:DUF1761 domain-containing protein n=1 Tax=Reichenbachiella faecimaris TaxID=692418 RepID=A0A1W2G831_REIFA|nr:DUF1761 domain-containing protein [Reichenbachiella faecimaris]SMD32761.1 Protein of unknown function [Reichenbachiella faecimaris]
MDTLNYWAILAAALSTFLIGGIWYSPIAFGKAWMKENSFSEDDLKKGNMSKIFGLSFILGLVAAINLAMFLGPDTDLSTGAFYGFLAGAGWVATFLGTHYLFERRSFKLFLINAGYSVVALTLMGLIIGGWR